MIRVVPKPRDWNPYDGIRVWRHTEGRQACKESGRNYNDPVTNQGEPQDANNHKKLGRSKEGFSPKTFRGSTALASLFDF